MKRHQVWSVKTTPDGDFVSATFECLLCDLVVVTHSPACAMMQICDECARKEPKREDIDRIFRAGFDQRRAMIEPMLGQEQEA